MKYICFLISILLFTQMGYTQSFKNQQKQYERVRFAYREAEKPVREMYKANGIDTLSAYIFIRVFKQEKVLEVWAKEKSDTAYTHITDYKICASSGQPGPKRIQGDGQVPEGFYHIDRFNPWSSFYLSLGLNYPNKSDRILGDSNPGGDIFIHGSCATIGCIPITDEKIIEVYLMAVEAKNCGQANIPVHIFPARLSDELMAKLKTGDTENEILQFWMNLKEGFDYFEKYKKLPVVTIDAKGKYIFK
ncbi:MAG: L,D-transpeptidase family protein [Bacteroidota bacterium]